VLRIRRNSCPNCSQSSHIYLSRFRTVWEVGALLLLLRPVRCHGCLSRFYRPLFMKTLPPPPATTNDEELENPLDAEEVEEDVGEHDRRSA
jgi:hypothetical protein